MSLYFDGFFACKLKPDTPQQVIAALQYMTRRSDHTFTDLPDHRFFGIEGWEDFLQIAASDFRCSPGLTGSELHKVVETTGLGTSVEYYTISFRRTMHDDVEFYLLWNEFLEWIKPYCGTEGFVGFYREEFERDPVLLYVHGGQMAYYKVESKENTSGNSSDQAV